MMNKMTMESTIEDVYNNPIGHDILHKVLMQSGLPDNVLKPVKKMRLKTLSKLLKKKLGDSFFITLIDLLNIEKDIPCVSHEPVKPAWWKEAVFYQIYPRSFYDTNYDGIGDLRGIIEKLDYLKDLGIDAIWLSPIYDSPNDDNGYDIRDYEKIMTEFGIMEDFDELLDGIHQRGMKLIMDLVVNHTSDEHKWFQEALNNSESPYRNYYFFREHPNNWTSFFSGSSWNYYPEQNIYALHTFSKKQMDLNWECEDMRNDVIDMINRWLDKGVDGFRMDVINFISKKEGLPDGNPMLGEMMEYRGIEHYFYGPHLHDYLKEIHEKAFAKHHAFSVGETPGLGMHMAQLVSGEERKELDMIFSFDHLESPGHVRFDDYRYDLNYYKRFMDDHMKNYGNDCWLSLFYNNHDNPKMASKINPDIHYTLAIQELLAIMQMTMKGTPFIFQGEEMGLVNYDFHSIKEITDVESRNLYKELCLKMNPEKAFKIIKAGTREHARVLLPWNDIEMPEHLRQEIDLETIDMYKELISLRKANKVLIYGDYKALRLKKDVYTYERYQDEESMIIDCNLCDHEKKAYLPEGYTCIYPKGHVEDKLMPYEARIWKKD